MAYCIAITRTSVSLEYGLSPCLRYTGMAILILNIPIYHTYSTARVQYRCMLEYCMMSCMYCNNSRYPNSSSSNRHQTRLQFVAQLRWRSAHALLGLVAANLHFQDMVLDTVRVTNCGTFKFLPPPSPLSLSLAILLRSTLSPQHRTHLLATRFRKYSGWWHTKLCAVGCNDSFNLLNCRLGASSRQWEPFAWVLLLRIRKVQRISFKSSHHCKCKRGLGCEKERPSHLNNDAPQSGITLVGIH